MQIIIQSEKLDQAQRNMEERFRKRKRVARNKKGILLNGSKPIGKNQYSMFD